MLKKFNNKKGFTLVELLIVILIMCILAAILIPSFAKYVKQAQNATILAEARAAHVAASVICQRAAVLEKYDTKTGALGTVAFATGAASADALGAINALLPNYTDITGTFNALSCTEDGTVESFTFVSGDKQVAYTTGLYTVTDFTSP